MRTSTMTSADARTALDRNDDIERLVKFALNEIRIKIQRARHDAWKRAVADATIARNQQLVENLLNGDHFATVSDEECIDWLKRNARGRW